MYTQNMIWIQPITTRVSQGSLSSSLNLLQCFVISVKNLTLKYTIQGTENPDKRKIRI